METPPQSITESSIEQGLGTPESPVGAKIAGATPQQSAMTGTPAQSQNAIQQKQEQRTLESTQRYTPKPATPTPDDQQAKEKAESLSKLGPVRSRVEGLIQEKVTAATQQQAGLSLNEANIAALPPEQQEGARQALNNFMQATTDEEREAALIQLAQATGGTASLEGGGYENYFMESPEALSGLAQEQLAGTVTLGDLDPTQLGLSEQELVDIFGPEWTTMTLDQMDDAIDAIEAQEFNQVDQIRAELADPRTPPARRQELLRRMADLSAAGLTGAEADIEALDAAIQRADTVTIDGREMSLEEALGDEGISAAIARAVEDPEMLQRLKEDPRYASLGQWIETQKTALEGIIGEVGADVSTFMETQEGFEELKQKFGEDGLDLLQALAGEDLGEYTTAADLTRIQTVLDGNKAYQFLTEDPESMWVQEAKTNPDVLEDLKYLASTDIESADFEEILELQQDIEGNDFLAKVIGEEGLPGSIEELNALRAKVDAFESLDPEVTAAFQDAFMNDKMDFPTLKAISDIEDEYQRAEVISDIEASVALENSWKQAEAQGKSPNQMAKELVFGPGDYSARDMTYTLKSMPDSEAAKMISEIFDANNDGVISEQEFNSAEAGDRAKAAMGIGVDPKAIIDKGGTWEAFDTTNTAGQIANAAEANIEDQIKYGILDQDTINSITTKAVQEEEARTEYLNTKEEYADDVKRYQDIVDEATEKADDLRRKLRYGSKVAKLKYGDKWKKELEELEKTIKSATRAVTDYQSQLDSLEEPEYDVENRKYYDLIQYYNK